MVGHGEYVGEHLKNYELGKFCARRFTEVTPVVGNPLRSV